MPFLAVGRFRPFGEVAISVLHHDDGRINEHADCERKAAQRHDV